MPGVALHPVPGDTVRPGETIELLPQVHVLHRLLVGGAPAAALPLRQPFADALLHVLRIGVDLDPARRLERFQRADDRGELHAIVGRLRLAAEQLPFLTVNLQDRAPASPTGVALAGSVGVDTHEFRVSAVFAARLSRHSGLTSRMPTLRLIARTT